MLKYTVQHETVLKRTLLDRGPENYEYDPLFEHAYFRVCPVGKRQRPCIHHARSATACLDMQHKKFHTKTKTMKYSGPLYRDVQGIGLFLQQCLKDSRRK